MDVILRGKTMKINIQKIICLALVTIFLVSTNALAFKTTNNPALKENKTADNSFVSDDIDPLVDLAVTVKIKEIRALDKIDLVGDPDFYVKMFINGVEHTSPIWHNQKYVKPNWSITQDVPDNEEFVNITIQLWDWNLGKDKMCDISINDQANPNKYYVALFYNLKSGHWMGDDYIYPRSIIFDLSGYGRLNGCDDNSIYQNDKDCELLFDISQNDYDGDGIPYWTELNVFHTDPTVDNRGEDADHDGVPIEWEYEWGHSFGYNHSSGEIENRWMYDPFVWEDHRNLDSDDDGLDNVEEYLASQWGSDPFRKDIFLEIDQMELGPNGEGVYIPELSKDLIRDAFSKHNIVLHIDDGSMGGGELVLFDNSTTDEELQDIYFNYFLHGDPNNWRRGAFHYAIIAYHSARYAGFVFGTTADGENYTLDSLQISTDMHETFPFKNPIYNSLRRKSFNREYQREIVYAGAIMHETGHTLGVGSWNAPGCDNPLSVFPKRDWWKFHSYRSCMNYDNTYYLVDYSDGSHGKNDFDDWGNIDLTFFQTPSFWH